MKKTLLFLLLLTHSYSLLQAQTVFQLWNKSKVPFYVALLGSKDNKDGGRKMVPINLKKKPSKPSNITVLSDIEFTQLQPGERIDLTDQEFDQTRSSVLFLTDFRKFHKKHLGGKDILHGPLETMHWELDPPVAFRFKPGKDIFVRIKKDVSTFDTIRHRGFGPQAGSLKTGINRKKTKTGLPLQNNVTPEDIKKMTYYLDPNDNQYKFREGAELGTPFTIEF